MTHPELRALRLITAATVEPVSLETVKGHLRIDTDDEDAVLDGYIKAAREQAELLSRRAFLTQTFEAVFDNWPSGMILPLPRPPLASVTSVKYYDTDNVEATWTDYETDSRSEPGKIIFNTLPGVALLETGGVAVRFSAGYGDTPDEVPPIFRQAILMIVAHWYENREQTISGTIIAEVPNGPRKLLTSKRVVWF